MTVDKHKAPRTAVALQYEPGKDSAPRVLAAGRGELADALLDIAREHRVPVQTDPALAEALVKLEVGTAIPPELYAAVAEVLAFLWRLEREGAAGEGAEA